VLMAGELGEDPPQPPHPRNYDAQPVSARLAIMFAGPVFSALLAVLLMWGAFMGGVETPAYLREAARIGTVEEASPAAAAGLRPGDLVLAAGERETATWEALTEVVLTNPGARLDLRVERGGEILALPVDVKPSGKNRIGWIGANPCASVIVGAVSDGSGAEAAGLKAGDRIESVDGAMPCGGDSLVALVQASGGAPLKLRLVREGAEIDALVTPALDETGKQWLMGVRPALATVTERHGPVAALGESLRYNARQSVLLVDIVGKLITGRISLFAMSGPLEMAEMAQETASVGLTPFVSLVALITLNLAVLNLLPIPVLDGGKIVLLLLEAIRGRELERRTKEWILQAGLAMIVVLMVTVLVMDFIKKGS
jgi:regulator of sigma E protease